jgi:type II secretory pathway pseudopilin PulG
MRKKSTSKRNQKRQGGFSFIEVMGAILILLVGVVGVAQLVPAAVHLNGANRADSSSMVYAQREMDQFVDQPLSSTTTFTDQQGNAGLNLGGSATFNALIGSPVTTLAGRVGINYGGAQVAGYSYNYHDPADTSGTFYDVRWAFVLTGTAGNVTSRRIILGVMKRGGDLPLPPVTLDTLVEK